MQAVHFSQPSSSPPDVARFALSANERKVLQMVRLGQAATRAEITQATTLTAQSISRIVDSLVARGLLTLGERVIQGRGQPSVRLDLNRGAAHSIGLSIMTDAVSGAVMNLAGEVVATRWQHLVAFDQASILGLCRALYDELLGAAGLVTRDLAGVGVGVTGAFTGTRRQVNPPELLDALALVDLDQLLANTLERPVWVDNDGNVAAMGEALNGVGRRHTTFAYLFFAMGFGGGVVINGTLYPGVFGNAGEFAGILPPDQQDTRPTLELLRVLMARNGRHHRDIYDMIRHFDPDDPAIAEWLSLVVPKLSAVVSAISAVLDPEVIVLGGRLPRPLADQLVQAIGFYSVPRRGLIKPLPALLVTEVDGDAAAIGAAAVPLKVRFFG
ncbi:ROK family protein [Altererythrobacter aerius]|uniref:ROK family protein n=1 Tax=Tsuneonella aeria TaxID=1837929 RepID=A0A6I4TGX9_9SPHN|nr:ROK family transcriptional regulator [Tsuneonella aeria]MXO75926.1 ROK family protein [Tsuneonella aeria]